ncbi:MAG TPA: (Fe-S)-binding protein [Thermoplasmata archaeon]|nr:(Fe-S)-binding protein [Thermoplasmata archaeon]
MTATAVRPFDEMMDELGKAGGSSLYLCYQCGTCTATCPWSEVRDVSLRKMLRLTQLGLGGLEGDFLWLCTTCRACTARCPRGVDIPSVIRTAREFVTAVGAEPDALKTVLGRLSTVQNPWGGNPEERSRWAEGLTVRPFEPGMDLLLYVGCTAAYDPRIRTVARALVKILDAAGVRYGTLGNDEACCGDPALRIGDPALFRSLADRNAARFRERGVERIVTISPHSFEALKHEYPKLGASFEVEHYTQLLARLADEDRLKLKTYGGARVTYHDPCYLGRYNGVYEEPRKVLESIPGVRLEEMERNRTDSLCCGGGGGRIFLETPRGERFSDLRVTQAERTGAQVLCSACPYCVLNLEDSSKTVASSPLAVRDVAEYVAEHLM